uniref:Phospholipid phosphatase related 2a n=1 Tax=Nothobranchius furzeri TaxID=105023 RepID=A0A8C6NT17_NOTFU
EGNARHRCVVTMVTPIEPLQQLKLLNCHKSRWLKPTPCCVNETRSFPLQILVGELCSFFTKAQGTQEKTIVTADCCYFNPLLRRVVRFLGVYTFGLFTTTIFANAGQVVTGNQTPHFLSACRPNYTALGCQSTVQYITERRACTGNPLIVMSARKSFPSKDAALSVYSALYTIYVTVVFKTKGTRLTKPTISLTLLCLAFLVGVVRVAEYRNHWADVLAGFFTGGGIAVFLVRNKWECLPALDRVSAHSHQFGQGDKTKFNTMTVS